MISDAELLELEILFNDQFESFNFGKVFLNNDIGEILIEDNNLKILIDYCFKDRYEIRNEYFVITIEIFKILQSRYFQNNQTVFF